MGTLIGLVAMGALLLWLLGVGKRQTVPEPEDDVDSPIDENELREAEREIRDDDTAMPAKDAVDDDDEDWGPGTSTNPFVSG